MLDLALLTANAAQLKRILTIGPSHRFYYFLLSLITISILLQVSIDTTAVTLEFPKKIFLFSSKVIQAALMCILAIVFDLSNVEQHSRTVITNNILLLVTICSVSINIIISSFDIADVQWWIKNKLYAKRKYLSRCFTSMWVYCKIFNDFWRFFECEEVRFKLDLFLHCCDEWS